jgi:hypothetical protein
MEYGLLKSFFKLKLEYGLQQHKNEFRIKRLNMGCKAKIIYLIKRIWVAKKKRRACKNSSLD